MRTDTTTVVELNQVSNYDSIAPGTYLSVHRLSDVFVGVKPVRVIVYIFPTQAISAVITAPSQPGLPHAALNAPQSFDDCSTLRMSALQSHWDGPQPLAYAWSELSGLAIADPTLGRLEFAAALLDTSKASYTFTVTVTSFFGTVASASHNIVPKVGVVAPTVTADVPAEWYVHKELLLRTVAVFKEIGCVRAAGKGDLDITMQYAWQVRTYVRTQDN
jgi:hypothetical protein